MGEESVLREEKVPLKSRVWVSLADSSCALLGSLVTGGTLTYYFTRWRGLDPHLAGLVWLLFGIWNAINDPLFGHISDRTRSRLGRRIPYIRYGAPLYALFFIACWLNWPGTRSNQTAMFLQLFGLLFFFDALYTAVATSLYIMPYEMAVSNKARSSIFIWKIIFQVIPTAVPLVLIPQIQPGPGQDAGPFRMFMVAFGIVGGLIVLFSTFFYSEKHFQQQEEQFPLFRSVIDCFRNRSFVIFEVISFTIIYVQAALMQGVLYYFDELKVPGMPIFAALGLGIVIGVFLWIRQRDRWGVKRSVQYWCLSFAVGCALVMIFGHYLIPTAAAFFLFGIGFAGGMYLVPLMNGDVIDMDEHMTGLRREGMYAGVNSFVTKPAISIAQAAFLGIIGWFGYDQTLAKGMQSASAQTGILVGWMAVPAVLLGLCALAMFLYPLHGDKWNSIKRDLAEKHARKEKEYLLRLGLQPDPPSRQQPLGQ